MITKTIGFTIEIDEDAIAPASPEVFIFQLINRLGYEHTITSVTVDDATVDITHQSELAELPLKEGKQLQ